MEFTIPDFTQLMPFLKENKRIIKTEKTDFIPLIDNVIDCGKHVDPSTSPHTVFSVDGSYACYWKDTNVDWDLRQFIHREIYYGVIRVGIIEQQYLPSMTCGEYKTVQNTAADRVTIVNLDPLTGKTQGLINASSKKPTTFTIGKVLGELMGLFEKNQIYTYADMNDDPKIILIDGALLKNWERGSLGDISPDFAKIIDPTLFKLLRQNSNLNAIIQICKKKGHILLGVSKDSAINYTDLNIPYTQALKKITPMIDGSGYYYLPITNTIFGAPDELTKEIQTVFARLHPNAHSWHRVDYLATNGYDFETEIFPNLANYSQCNAFFGVPNPPQVGHSTAVKIRRLQPFYLNQLRQAILAAGYNVLEYQGGLTDVNGNLLHARSEHDLLDLYV